MKIECLKEKLNSAVSKAEKVTGKNLTLPVLSCLYLEAKNNSLKIKATNLDLGIEITIPVKVVEEGIVAVPGGILNSYISNLSNDKNIKLEVVDGNLSVYGAKSSTVIKSFAHEDFPLIPSVSNEKSFKINTLDIVKGLKSVWYSSSTSSMKPELSSVYVYNNEEGLVFAATDSFRLAEKKVKVKNLKDFGQLLIPFKNVAEIIRVLEGISDEISIAFDNNQVSFTYDGLYLTSRIIDGTFPDYKQVVPKEWKTEVIVLKQDLMNAMKIANIFSDNFNQINIKALPSKKTFELTTKNSNIGENLNKIDANLSGEDIEINFNYKYITDCFQSIDSDSVSLDFNGLNRPIVIKGVSDNSFLYLVMPMNK
jgi:DNA polymerase-3 subunit beta